MAKRNPDAEVALHKFGQLLREGYAKKHPTQEKDLEPVKDAVREQYELEQEAKRKPTVEPPTPEKDRQPEEPEPER